jgi:hypothetical protein
MVSVGSKQHSGRCEVEHNDVIDTSIGKPAKLPKEAFFV